MTEEERPSARSPNCLGEVGLDTSALGALLDAATFDADRISAALRRHNLRLVIPEESLAECYVGATEHVTERFSNLHALTRVVPSHRIGYAVPLRRLLRREQRGHRFASSPVASGDVWPQLVAEAHEPKRFAAVHPERRQVVEATLAKHEQADADAEARDKVPTDVREDVVSDLPALIQRLGEVFRPERWPMCFVAPDADGDDPEATRRRLCAEPWAARAHAVLSGMMWLCATGAVLMWDKRLGRYGQELRWEEGNWSDARIAANLAYCPVLLTADKRLRARVHLLGKVGLAFTIPMDVADLPL